MAENTEDFDVIIRPQKGFLGINFAELLRYKDLLLLFVRRDIVVTYSQSILGPLWFLLTGLISTLVFVVVFGKIGQIPTDGLPQIAFYMSGITLWSYFTACVGKTQDCLASNAAIFRKVYFPRLYVPFSTLISNLVSFSLQFTMLIAVSLYLQFQSQLQLQWTIVFVPFIVFAIAVLALGLGLIVSALGVKYRDIVHVWGFAVTLLMYATPIVYPASRIPDSWRQLLFLNPLAPLVETYRYILFGVGHIPVTNLVSGCAVILVIFVIGLSIFTKVERNFIDSV